MGRNFPYLRKISLVFLGLAILIVLGVPASQAQRGGPPAPNDRCGPDLPGIDPCDGKGALTVPHAVTAGSSVRRCFTFDTTGATKGPIGVDVVRGTGATDQKDVWFRMAGPQCSGMKVIVNSTGSTYPARIVVVTQGGGLPFFVCDTTCGAVAGNPFFDTDFVVLTETSYNAVLPTAIASRDLYYLVSDARSGGTGGTLTICFTTTCP